MNDRAFFLGKGGVGKTTLARLLQQAVGARLAGVDLPGMEVEDRHVASRQFIVSVTNYRPVGKDGREMQEQEGACQQHSGEVSAANHRKVYPSSQPSTGEGEATRWSDSN